jgi:hypothetical protein
MHTSITSNWRPLLRAFYPFLIAITALGVMPKNACAQLYVTSRPGSGAGVVSEYDASTGKVINANFITGLDGPQGLAVLGDTLFVSNEGGTTVGEYDAKTGAAINGAFITGLQQPEGLAVKSAK